MPTEKIADTEEDAAWTAAPCQSRDHNPSGMRVFKPGRYRHTCSECGRSFEFVVHPNTLMTYPRGKIDE